MYRNKILSKNKKKINEYETVTSVLLVPMVYILFKDFKTFKNNLIS